MQHFDRWLFLIEHNTNRSPVALMLVVFLLYMGLTKVALSLRNTQIRKVAFVSVNLVLVSLLYNVLKLDLRCLAGYVCCVCGLWALTRWTTTGRFWMVATLAPIAMLAFGRYVFPSWGVALIGLSYMAFRLSQLVVIVRNRIVPMPDLLDYLSFAFFGPTLIVGPISSYSTFITSFSSPGRVLDSAGNCVLRIALGATKLLLFAAVFDRIAYVGLLRDGHAHPPVDLAIAAVAFYLYLYFNFSGFCDIAIGAAGLLGIKVSENFNGPFLARNMKDFWNRWHITLSSFMRDMFFNPVSRALVRRLPASLSSHAIALTIMVVFILIGMWHGRSPRFFVWGLLNGAGVVCNHYYGLALRKLLTPAQLKAYGENRFIHCLCVMATFMYVTATLALFANFRNDIEQILRALRA